jgi:hypothetical protein
VRPEGQSGISGCYLGEREETRGRPRSYDVSHRPVRKGARCQPGFSSAIALKGATTPNDDEGSAL